MTIQPEPWPFVPLRRTFATTPSPRVTRIIVPTISPRKDWSMTGILAPAHAVQLQSRPADERSPPNRGPRMRLRRVLLPAAIGASIFAALIISRIERSRRPPARPHVAAPPRWVPVLPAHERRPAVERWPAPARRPAQRAKPAAVV